MDASEDRKRQEEMEIFWGVRLGECTRGRAPYNPDDAASLLFALEIILDPRREVIFMQLRILVIAFCREHT